MSEIEPFLVLERSYFLLRPGDYPTLKLKVLYVSVWFRGIVRVWFCHSWKRSSYEVETLGMQGPRVQVY